MNNRYKIVLMSMLCMLAHTALSMLGVARAAARFGKRTKPIVAACASLVHDPLLYASYFRDELGKNFDQVMQGAMYRTSFNAVRYTTIQDCMKESAKSVADENVYVDHTWAMQAISNQMVELAHSISYDDFAKNPYEKTQKLHLQYEQLRTDVMRLLQEKIAIIEGQAGDTLVLHADIEEHMLQSWKELFTLMQDCYYYAQYQEFVAQGKDSPLFFVKKNVDVLGDRDTSLSAEIHRGLNILQALKTDIISFQETVAKIKKKRCKQPCKIVMHKSSLWMLLWSYLFGK